MKRNKLHNSYIGGGEPYFIDKKSEIGLLCIHGFTSTPRQYKDLASYFSKKGFTIYAPALAGHGTTPAELQKTTAEDWKEQIENDYQKLKSKVKKVFIIGNSFGGNIALHLADKFGEEISGLILMGTPIRLKSQRLIKARVFTYGWLKPYYSKPQRYYSIDYTDGIDEISYPVIPLKALRQFFRMIKETVFNLPKITSPALIVHANVDKVVDPRSAQYIHQYLGSDYKYVYLFDSNKHSLVEDEYRRDELFKKIHDFVLEINELENCEPAN